MDWKAFLRKVLFPPLWLTILLVVFSGVLLPIVFVENLSRSSIAYGVYVLSFYTLCVVCADCVVFFPKRRKAIRGKINDHPLGHRYLTDAAFKTHVMLDMSLAINLLYVGVNVLSWFLYRSMWFVVLACYYAILALMRYLLVRYVRVYPLGKNHLGELRRVNLCAHILLLFNAALTGAVLMIVYQDKRFEYHGVLIYVMAAYTFYMTVHTIVDLARYRKYKSPVMTFSKVVSLSVALVSMLSLETAMFSQFGEQMTWKNQKIMLAATGAVIEIIIVTMAVWMICRTKKGIRSFVQNGG